MNKSFLLFIKMRGRCKFKSVVLVQVMLKWKLTIALLETILLIYSLLLYPLNPLLTKQFPSISKMLIYQLYLLKTSQLLVNPLLTLSISLQISKSLCLFVQTLTV